MDTLDYIISVPIGEFCRLSGIGRTKVYELLDDCILESIYIGRRRLILLDSYRRLIEQQRRRGTPVSALEQQTDRDAEARRSVGRPLLSTSELSAGEDLPQSGSLIAGKQPGPGNALRPNK